MSSTRRKRRTRTRIRRRRRNRIPRNSSLCPVRLTVRLRCRRPIIVHPWRRRRGRDTRNLLPGRPSGLSLPPSSASSRGSCCSCPSHRRTGSPLIRTRTPPLSGWVCGTSVSTTTAIHPISTMSGSTDATGSTPPSSRTSGTGSNPVSLRLTCQRHVVEHKACGMVSEDEWRNLDHRIAQKQAAAGVRFAPLTELFGRDGDDGLQDGVIKGGRSQGKRKERTERTHRIKRLLAWTGRTVSQDDANFFLLLTMPFFIPLHFGALTISLNWSY